MNGKYIFSYLLTGVLSRGQIVEHTQCWFRKKYTIQIEKKDVNFSEINFDIKCNISIARCVVRRYDLSSVLFDSSY